MSEKEYLENEECDEEEEQGIDIDSYLLQHQILPNIQLDFSKVENTKVDKESFIKGVSEASYIAGFITTLKSVGLNPKDGLDLLINRETCEHNRLLQKMINYNNVEIADKQAIKLEQTQL